MTALVTEHLPLVAGAPEGIKKLRALILELAIRGTLVPQHPSDEPIGDLLARTAAAKAALQPRGRAKAQKSPSDLGGGSPFAIPSSWKWCRLADLVEVLNGRAYKKEELLEQGTPVLRVGNLFTSNHWYYSDLILDQERYCEPGDLLYAWSASFGPFIWAGERSIYHYHIWKLAPHSEADLSRRYLHDFLQAQTAAIKAAGHGVSMTHMTKEKMEQLAVPLPPLAEQHRIVAKVDELMALCDRLEADQADAEAAHAQLVQALLGSLTQATDAADFRAHWQRLSEHFHTLFTTEASIDALKQTVLRLGFMGKLVPHLDDVHASRGMLDAIATAKAQLPDAGRLRQADDSTPATRADVPFEFPAAWQVARMADLCEPVTSGSTPPPSEMNESEGIPFLKVYNIREQRIDFDYKRQFVDKAYHLAKMKRSALKPNDVVMNIVGPPLGKTAIIPDSYANWNCNQAIVFFRPIAPMNPRFIYLFLCEGSFLEGIELIGTAGQDNISVTKSRNIVVPIPTDEEQHRIVAKVDELMALCDQIKVNLAESYQQHGQLAKVLIEHALGINANLSKPHSDRPESNAPILNFDQERSPRLMTAPPATVEQFVDCINELGDLATPERLIKHTGLSEDVEAFYDLLRAARDCGAVVVPLGSDTAIRRARNAD